MSTIKLILICLFCAGLGATIFNCCQLLLPSKKIKGNFSKEQEKIAKDLTKKKDSLEKEISKEVEEKISSLREQANELQNKCNIEEQRYQRKLEKLEENYLTTRKNYEQMDKDEEIKRQSKLTNALYEERDKYQKSLNQLQASFKDEEDKIKENFFQFSEQINLQRETLEKEIQEYEDKQKKIIARFKQDEEIRQQRDFYHIKIDSAAQQDIYKLKNLALEFSKPEALYKILYEVYYKTKTNELFDRILGDKKDCGGIYKITNITNEKVYVGRTVNFKKRWIEHIKRGCNIDRISGKIYDAMFSEGIENFSFEIVEVCSKEEQAEKEKYWINFYKAMEYGYNSKAGG